MDTFLAKTERRITTVHLDVRLLQKVRDLARIEHRSMSGEIAVLLEEAIDARETKSSL